MALHSVWPTGTPRIHWTFAPKTPEISRSEHEGDEVGLVHLFALSIMMTTDKVPGIQLHSHPPSSVPKASGCSSYYATTTTTIAPSLQSDYGFHIP